VIDCVANHFCDVRCQKQPLSIQNTGRMISKLFGNEVLTK